MAGWLGEIGTVEWCHATNGVLSQSERSRFVAAVLYETVRRTPRVLLYRVGLRGRGPDPSSFAPPDSALTRRVLDACVHLHPMLIEHSHRSYLFARALAERNEIMYDDEALFVATMLHDFAFPKTDSDEKRCFAFEGAVAAYETLRETSLSSESLHEILNAITLHLNPSVAPSQGIIPHLMHAGVMMDVVGVRAWELSWQGIQKVVERHPRHGFLHRGIHGFRAHAKRVPGSRAQRLLRCGLPLAQRLGPWHAHEARNPT